MWLLPAKWGVDSLVAVELPLWPFRHMGMDVPVLKAPGAMTLGKLVPEAIGKFW
jgi:hypothetical protein